MTDAGVDAQQQPPASPSGRDPVGSNGRDRPPMFSTADVPPNEPPSGIPVSHPPSFLSAEELCRVAAGLVGGPRRVIHGDKSVNFTNTADAWNALLRAKARQSLLPVERIPILDALDVANMLELFKVARRYSGKFNIDDYIDGAGYAACAGEIAQKDQE